EVISGADGWKKDLQEKASSIAAQSGCLVVGVDLNSYEQNVVGNKFFCPGADLVGLSIYAQKTLGMKHYVLPFLIGLNEGSGTVYAALAQNPNSYLGGIGFGFCPDFPAGIGVSCFENTINPKKISVKKVALLPISKLNVPFFVM